MARCFLVLIFLANGARAWAPEAELATLHGESFAAAQPWERVKRLAVERRELGLGRPGARAVREKKHKEAAGHSTAFGLSLLLRSKSTVGTVP